MFLVKISLNFILLTCILLKLTNAAPGGSAHSHIFQSTPDYTINHQHFHEHVKIATPYLDAESKPEISSIYINPNVNPNPSQIYEKQQQHQQPESLPTGLISYREISGLEKSKNDLPPGYVALPAMIDVPSGYQLFKNDFA